MLLRHETPRKYQKELIEDISKALETGSHLVAHAPTGIGKTDAITSVTVPFSLETGKLIVYLSPKISQHENVVRSIKGIMEKYDVRIKTVELVGRQYMCIHPLASRLSGEDFYEVCKKLREREECPFYVNYYSGEWGWEGLVVTHRYALTLGESREICPYEWASGLLKDAQFVIGDFYHIFSPRTGQVILSRLDRELEDTVIVVDEAHNLPDRIRKVLSFSLRDTFVERAIEEAASVDESVEEILRDLLSFIRELPEGTVEVDLFDSLFNPEEVGEHLEELGKLYLDASGKTKSYLLRVGRVLKYWKEGDTGFFRYVYRNKGVSVVKRALDPSYVTEEIAEKVHSLILVSGTLTPPEMYMELLGMERERTMLREYPSPFPRENRLIVVDTEVTTRFSQRRPSMFRKIGERVSRVIEATPGNTAVFFPSYDVMRAVEPYVQTDRPVLIQEERMGPKETLDLVRKFKEMRDVGAVLMGVAGGSLSEGVDYPGKDLLTVIVVGIPLSDMTPETEALISYYEEKTGRGWMYGYIYPAITRTLQAAGRCIRSETDVGAIVLMDERYTWSNYKKAFPKDFIFLKSQQPWELVEEFFRRRGLYPRE